MSESEIEPPRLATPAVVWALLGAIVASYLAYALAPIGAQDLIYYNFALIPDRFNPASEQHFTHWYEYLGPLVGHAFLHVFWLHAALNAFFFFLLGRYPASRLGAWRFLALYFVSAAVGALFYLGLNWGAQSSAIGASGAVCGVFMAYYLSARPTWRAALADPLVRNQLLMIVFINVVVMGVLEKANLAPIAWEGHLGGFIGGAIAYIALERPLPRGPWSETGLKASSAQDAARPPRGP